MARRTVLLPLQLQRGRSGVYKPYDLADCGVRAQIYSATILHGTANHMLNWICCDLLTEAWDADAIVLPREVRADWLPLITAWKADK